MFEFFKRAFNREQKLAPYAGSGMMSLIGSGFSGPTTAEGALEVNAVFAAARVIAEGVAQMPVRLVEVSDTTNGRNRRIAREHWAHKLLSQRPNAWQTPHEFIEGMVFSAVLGKAALAIKVMVGEQVRELLPVPPSCWTVEQMSDYSLRYRVQFSDGKHQYFTQDQVFTFRGVSLDGFAAIPAIEKARRAIGLSQALEKQQAQLAENGGRPSGILTIKNDLSDEAKSRLRETWQANFGPSGKGGIAVLDNENTYAPMTLSLADSQFIESRRFMIEDIARAFRVSPLMIQQADKAATFASAEQMFRQHVVHTLMPWVSRVEHALNRDIINNDPRFRFDFDNLEMLRGDLASQGEFYVKALGAGGQPAFMSVNEVREELGYNPIIGDEFYAKPQKGSMKTPDSEKAKNISDGA